MAFIMQNLIIWRLVVVVNFLTKPWPKGRVRTNPFKVWIVLKFNVEIFKTLKSLENDHRYGKILENCNADLEKADVNYTVDYP